MKYLLIIGIAVSARFLFAGDFCGMVQSITVKTEPDKTTTVTKFSVKMSDLKFGIAKEIPLVPDEVSVVSAVLSSKQEVCICNYDSSTSRKMIVGNLNSANNTNLCRNAVPAAATEQ